MPQKTINAAILGLGFGAEFIPIHKRASAGGEAGNLQRAPEKLKAVGHASGIEQQMADTVLMATSIVPQRRPFHPLT